MRLFFSAFGCLTWYRESSIIILESNKKKPFDRIVTEGGAYPLMRFPGGCVICIRHGGSPGSGVLFAVENGVRD